MTSILLGFNGGKVFYLSHFIVYTDDMGFFGFRKKVGLALGSGGTRGFAHIGAIKALQAHNIPIDYIAGCSAGAIVGGAFAVESDLSKLESFIETLPYMEMIKSFSDINLRDGIIKGDRFLSLLKNLVGELNIDDCNVPFTAVAAEKESGDAVLISNGSLADAMRASSSIPILFSPFKHKELGELVDGGVMQQVPVDIVKDMGADIVIAVNLSESDVPYNKKSNVAVMQNYMNLILKGLARANCKAADVVIEPAFQSRDWISNFQQRAAVIAAGYNAMSEKIPMIKKLL